MFDYLFLLSTSRYNADEEVNDSYFTEIKFINLENKLLGDLRLACLVDALPFIPKLEMLNLAGNRLTDKSIQPILKNLLQTTSCTYLNLSENKLDTRSVEMIRDILALSHFHLQVLILCAADVDDEESALLLSTLVENRELTVLNLSRNSIGGMQVHMTIYT
jgi:hypothetical protein